MKFLTVRCAIDDTPIGYFSAFELVEGRLVFRKFAVHSKMEPIGEVPEW